MDTPRLKQNFNQLFIFLGKTFKVLIKVECLSFQSVGTEFSDLEYIPRYGLPKFCLYQFMWVEDTKINLSSLANLVEDNTHPLGTWPVLTQVVLKSLFSHYEPNKIQNGSSSYTNCQKVQFLKNNLG